jgi:hypothetical protein
VTVELPRHVILKKLSSGQTAYYYNVPTKYRALKCPVSNEPLGTDFAQMKERADTLNGQFDEWDQIRKGLPVTGVNAPKCGTVDWLFREYKISKAYLEKVAARSRDDYERWMDEVCNTTTRKGDRVGDRLVKTISPRGADKLYDKFIIGRDGQQRLRTAEKMVVLCRKAWRVVRRLFPNEFPKDVPNPWIGVTMKTRVKNKKPAVTREDVYTFAHGCIEHGEIEAAAVAVICFEWLQRPENVIAGHIKWTGYRTGPKPTIRIEHHKTGEIIDHPLEEDGVKFYADAEEVLAKLSRRGVPMILRAIEPGKSKPFAFSTMQHIVQRMRVKLELPHIFTFDACRHGGMTELEEAELTDGQGRALSAHRTQQSYAGYAKRTEKRMLSATRKRHAHRLANEIATSIQNGRQNSVQNEAAKKAV